MSEIIGKGVIEVSADATKLKAGIDDAKRSLKSLGGAQTDASKKASDSIDRYVKSLATQAATLGKSRRETETYKLALRGASDAQLKAADSALKLSEGYERNAKMVHRIRTGLIASAAAAGVVAGGFTAMLISSINAADHLNDLSKTTGISVEKLSGLALAAKQSGTDLDGVAASISKLSQNIGKDGEKFRALGVTAKDPLEAFKQLADIFVAVEDPQARAALGAAALGKSWQSAAPLLAEGGKNIGEMVAKGMRLSGVTKQMAEDADKFNDQLVEMKTAASGLGTKLAGEMLPALTDITKAIMAAYEESGKLSAVWVALGGLGAFLFTDEFSSNTVKLKNINKELEGLQARQKDIQGAGPVTKFLFGSDSLDGQIKQLEGQRAALQKAMTAPPKAVDVKKPPDPKLAARVANFINEPKDGKGGANQEAKARLALDLDQIKHAADALTNTYGNAEKIMEAQRAAGLVDERAYYASKIAFLNLNSQAQDDALSKELARLQAEKLGGKDAADNARKIAEAQAKLAKLRENSVASLQVLSIQEEAAGKRLAQSYTDATIAAQAYIDTVNKQNAREIAGIGKGEKFRSEQAGISAIEDKQTTARQDLEGDLRRGQINKSQFDEYLATVNDTYAKEVEAYAVRTATINRMQGEWSIGASEAMRNYYDNSRNIAAQTASVFTNAFQGMEDAIIEFGRTGKLSFKDMAESIIADLARIEIKRLAGSMMGSGGSGGSSWLATIAGAAAGYFGGTGAQATLASSMGGDSLDNMLKLTSNFSGRAIGGPVSAGGLYRVNEKGPELLNVAGKQYLMMGSQGGSVTNNTASTGGDTTILNVNVTPPAGSSAATAQQWGATAGRQIRRATARNT